MFINQRGSQGVPHLAYISIRVWWLITNGMSNNQHANITPSEKGTMLSKTWTTCGLNLKRAGYSNQGMGSVMEWCGSMDLGMMPGNRVTVAPNNGLGPFFEVMTCTMCPFCCKYLIDWVEKVLTPSTFGKKESPANIIRKFWGFPSFPIFTGGGLVK